MARLPRRIGKVLYSNLTRNLAEGESPDAEFIYLILDYVPSLRSQVYIHRNDIIEGSYEDFPDGAEVELAPEEVPEEKFQKALEDGNPIRKFVGRDVVLASSSARPSAGNVDPQVSSPQDLEPKDKREKSAKTEQKLEYSLELTPLAVNRFSIVGKVNNKLAELTYIISAVGDDADKVKFIFLGSEELEFYKFHPGLKVEDGVVDFEVNYEKGSLNIMVRCLESNLTKYTILMK